MTQDSLCIFTKVLFGHFPEGEDVITTIRNQRKSVNTLLIGPDRPGGRVEVNFINDEPACDIAEQCADDPIEPTPGTFNNNPVFYNTITRHWNRQKS